MKVRAGRFFNWKAVHEISEGGLELTWMGKDMALIPTAHGKYDYKWVDHADPRSE